MAITVSTGYNPKVSLSGKLAADSTQILSGYSSGMVQYQIRNADGSDTFSITSTDDVSKITQVVAISSSELKIVLPFRRRMQVRVRQNGGTWTDWTSFKTRDKTYATPDSTTQLSDNSATTATSVDNRTIVVTNAAKATTTLTSTGATVSNTTDTGYVGTTSVTITATGATVVTDTF